MAAPRVTEGTMPFRYPSIPKELNATTWYKVVGDLKCGKRPLVTLHGGPGGTHQYLKTPFDDFAAQTGTPVVFYDQFGCGNSTRYREQRLNETFWTIDLFIAELDQLLAHLGIRDDFDLFGHSWGGMLGPKFAVSPQGKTSGLHKLIIGSGPASMTTWTAGAKELLKAFPDNVREAIEKYSKLKEWDNPEYQAAVNAYYKRHMCRLEEWPQILLDTFAALEEDDTAYLTMNGPDDITTIGNLRTFDMTEECKDIKVPTLLIHGEHDEAQPVCQWPWFKGIDKVKWVTVAGGSHMAHLEYPEQYVTNIREFLSD